MGFSRAGIGVFVVAALGFLGVGIGVFAVVALVFLSVGIGVFVVAALVFFVGREIGVYRAQCAGVIVFFWEKAPGNGRAGGPGELARPGGEVVGLTGCKEGNRPLLPYPRASLTASRLADTALQLPNSCESEPR